MNQICFSMMTLLLFGGCSESTQGAVETNPVDVGQGQGDSGLPPMDADSQGARLVINEVMFSPADDGSDWIEVVVVGEGVVELSEYTLIDDNLEHTPFVFPAGELSSGSFKVFQRGGEDSLDGFGFGLGKNDGLWLRRGEDVTDMIEWREVDAPAGATYGRLPDGTGDWRATEPTMQAPNMAYEGELLAGVLFDDSRVVGVELILSPDAWSAIREDPLAEEYHSGAIVFDGTRVEDVAIRVKGNSSLNSVARSPSERFSFKVDANRNVPGQTVRGAKKLNFNNGFKDPTFMREHLGYGVFERAGMPGSRTAFVDLTVAGQHMGVYTLVEQVDDDFLERHFGDDDGDMYKPEPPAGQLTYRGAEINNYERVGIENNEETTDHSPFLRFIAVLNNEGEGQLDEVINVDGVLRNLAINTVMVNLDSYLGMGHNFYLYEQDGRFVDVPWDLNETYGNFTCQCDRAGLINLKIDEPTCGELSDRPFVARLLNDPDYLERYHEILRELVDGPAAVDTMRAFIQSTADVIRPFVQADPTKFFSEQEFETGLVDDVGGGRGGAWGLESFIRDRNEAILRQLDGVDPSTNQGNGNCGRGGGVDPGGGMQGGGQNCPPCGDGLCDDFEMQNPEVCPRDCREPPPGGDWCGDGLCDALERCEQSCPADCD